MGRYLGARGRQAARAPDFLPLAASRSAKPSTRLPSSYGAGATQGW